MNLVEHWRIRDKGTETEKLTQGLHRTEVSLSMLWEMYNRLRDDWNSMFKLEPHRWKLRDKYKSPESEGPE